MAKETNYHKIQDQKNTLKLRELCMDLPPYVKDFFRAIDNQTTSRTRIAYTYDLRVFYNYLHEHHSLLSKKQIIDISLSDLESLHPQDIEEYLEYIKVYTSEENEIRSNDVAAVKRKLASLRSFYRYFYRRERITYNPVQLVDMPKMREKGIIRLDSDEVGTLLDHVENGAQMSQKQRAFHEKTKVRDLTMMTLLLGTGIRVSECVGLNISDVDFHNNGIHIIRKGGKEVTVYFGDEVCDQLNEYMNERTSIIPMSGHEDALFLSTQKRRMTTRAVENMVKKYTRTVTTTKNITPHKLRSTYGTNLYKATGDIYLVADVLGHSDVNTTKKHYAALEDDRRRSARDMVQLRNDKNHPNP